MGIHFLFLALLACVLTSTRDVSLGGVGDNRAARVPDTALCVQDTGPCVYGTRPRIRSHWRSLSLSLSLSTHTHTHTHTHFLSLSHTHTHTQRLSLSLDLQDRSLAASVRQPPVHQPVERERE